MPYITKLAPGQESLEVLRSLYIKTERKIINEITRKRNLELVDYADVAALERVQAILRDMTDKTDEYVPQVIEKYFYNENTMPGASKGYINAMSLTSTQTNIAQILINNLLAQIDEAAGVAFSSASKFLQIGRLEADELRSLTLEAAAEREALGRGWQTIQNELAAQLNAKGLTSFTDAAGREWSLANYCTMATRTTGRQAQVAAALTADDHDLWQISKIGSTCPVCSVYEGRVYSKSGTNPDYPPLAMAFGKIDPEGSDDLSNTYLNIHPNCLHSLIRYTTIGKTEEQIEKDKKFSSFTERPDTADYRSKRQVKAYREKEAARAKYRQDLKQFEKYKAALGKDMPKTFETFEKHKKLDDDLYKSWEQGFREMNAKAKKIKEDLNSFADYDEIKVAEALKPIEIKAKSYTIEHLSIVNPKGEVVFTNTGSENQVEAPDNIIRGNIITHNHPGGSCFSAQDIETTVSSNGIEIRATTPNGTYYSLRKVFESDKAKRFANDFDANTGILKALDIGREMIKNGELDKDALNFFKAQEISDGLKIDFLEKHAEEYGFIFKRGKI